MKSLIVFLLVVAVLCGAGYMAAKYLKPAGVEVPIVAAKRGEFVIRTFTRGDMRTLKSSTLVAPNVGSGLIATHLVGTGESVKEDEVVMEFDAADLENTLEAAKAQMAMRDQDVVRMKADQEIQKQQDLVNVMRTGFAVRQAELTCKQNELVSTIDAEKNNLNLERAKSNLEQTKQDIVSTARQQAAETAVMQEQLNTARAQAAQIEGRIARLTVKSPIRGLASIRQNMRSAGGFQMIGQDMPEFKEGDSINSGDAVLEVVDNEQMEVAGKIPELARGNLHEGQEVNIRLDALPGEVFPGKIKTLSGMTSRDVTGIDPTKTFDVAFSLTKQDPRLRPGMSAEVEIITDRVASVVFVPLQAVFDKDNKKVVYLKQGEQYLRREVTLGARSESQVIIEKGLSGTEQVALLDPEARSATAGSKKSGSSAAKIK